MSVNPFATPHRFFLFRHGIATHSTTGYGDQVFSAPLLPEAYPVITRLGQALKGVVSHLHYRSPVLRCQQTADIVTKETGKVFLEDVRLTEYHQESFAHLAARIAEFLTETIAHANTISTDNENEPTTIMICTHGSVLAGLQHYLIDGNFFEHQELNYPNPGELLTIYNQTLQLQSFAHPTP